MELNKSLRLSPGQYFTKKYDKNLLTLHHTVGGSARSTFRCWASDRVRVATTYLIDRDGTVYEVFPPECWGGHHGVKGDRNRMDKRSIGIELCNYGPVYGTKGNFKTEYKTPFRGEVYVHGSKYRHSNMFELYTIKQMSSLANLINYLIARFPTIPRDTPESKETDYNRFKNYRGIIGHFHVRDDKSDVHPGFSWDYLKEKCNLNYD